MDDGACKPHKGSISDWQKVMIPFEHYYDGEAVGLGYFIVGRFVTHPDFAGRRGHTSYIVAHDAMPGEVETRNSRYTLVGPPVGPAT